MNQNRAHPTTHALIPLRTGRMRTQLAHAALTFGIILAALLLLSSWSSSTHAAPLTLQPPPPTPTPVAPGTIGGYFPCDGSGSVAGQVIVPGGTPFTDGYVSIRHTAMNVHCPDGYLDEDGYFTLPNLRDGVWAVRAYPHWGAAPGFFRSAEVAIEIVDGASVQLTVPLQLGSPQARGKVILPDGTPIEGMAISIETAINQTCPLGNGYGYAPPFMTDDQGIFVIGGLDAGDYCLRFYNYHAPVSPVESLLVVPPPPTLLTIEDVIPGSVFQDLGLFRYMQPNKQIIGVVQSADGIGVPGVRAEAYGAYSNGHTLSTTDASGTFTLTVSGGEWTVNIYADHEQGTPWFSHDTQRTVRFAENNSAETQTVTFPVSLPDATITGRIVDPDGQPIAILPDNPWSIGVEVYPTDAGYYVSRPVDGSGAFAIPVVAGQYQVHIRLDEYLFPHYFVPVLAPVQVVSGAATGLGDIRLFGPQVTGQVMRPDNQPLAHVGYTIFPAPTSDSCDRGYGYPGPLPYPAPGPYIDTGLIERYGETDSNGIFRMGGLVIDEYCLIFQQPWGPSSLLPPPPIRFTVTDLYALVDLGAIAMLPPTKHIVGTVQDDQGAPIVNVAINANRYSRPGWTATQTDGNGQYDLAVDGGDWNITANAYTASELYRFTEEPYRTVQFAEDQTPEMQTLDFTAERANATITGRLLGPDGEILSPQYNGLTMEFYNAEGYGGSAVVGSDGHFQRTIFAGVYQVNLWLDEYVFPNVYFPTIEPVRVAANATTDMGTLQLRRKSSIVRGMVLDDVGNPQANARVAAWGDNGGWAQTITNASGVYSMTVRAGHLEVMVEQDYPATYFVLEPPQRVTVADNDTVVANFTVRGTAGKIIGTVTDANGNVLTDVYAHAYARRVGDADGVVASGQLPALPPSAFDVWVDGEVRGGRFELNVPAGIYQVGLYLPPGGEYAFLQEAGTSITRMSDLRAFAIGQRVAAAASNITSSGNRLAGEQLAVVMDLSTHNANVVAASGVARDVAQASGLRIADDAEVTIVLQRHDATITGTLRNPDGTPATGIHGEIYAWTDLGVGVSQFGTINAATGTYDINVAAATWNLDYYIHTDDYLGHAISPISVTVTATETVEQDLTLRPLNAIIRGTALDPEGEPLPYAYVWANTDDRRFGHGHHISVQTHNGQFEMKALSGERYMIGAEHYLPYYGYPGGAQPSLSQPPVQVVTPTVDASAEVTLQFRRPDATIVVDVVESETSTAASHAYVYAWSDDGQHLYGDTAADGRAEFAVTSDTRWYVGATWYPGHTTYFFETTRDVAVDVPADGRATLTVVVHPSVRSLPPSVVESFDVGQAWTKTLADGTRIDIPAGAIPVTNLPGNDVILTVTPLIEGLPSTLLARPIDYGYAIHLNYQSGGQIAERFNANATLTFFYSDEDLAELGISEEEIAPAFFSTTSNTWSKLNSFTIDTENNQITAQVNHFSNWALVVPSSTANAIVMDKHLLLPAIRR